MIALLLAATALANPNAHALNALGTDGDAAAWSGLAPLGDRHPGAWDLGVVLTWSDRPLLEDRPDGPVAVVRGLGTATLTGGITVARRLDLDVALPVHWLGLAAHGAFAGPGDLRLGARWTALKVRGARPGLGVAPSVWLPTGADARFLGSPTVAAGGVLVVGQELGRFGWIANLGARVAPSRPDRNLRAGPGPLLGLGVHLRPTDTTAVTLEATAHGAHGWTEWPVEVAATFRQAKPSGASWFAGASLGLTDAVGSASWRAWVGTSFGARPGVEPVDAPVEPVASADPVVDPAVAEAPQDPEARDPGDPLPEHLSLLDLGETEILALLEHDRIVVKQNLFFAEDSDTLLAAAEPTLDAVRQILVDNPRVVHLLVEGHTNHHGSPEYNVDLSERRAKAVVTWLVRHQIAAERLVYKGYGLARPLVPLDHPLATRINRRVEFTVLRSDELPDDVRIPDARELAP